MPFRKVESPRVATSIAHQIEGLILKGILRPGERLPSERDLAAQMEVSRPSLREALAELEESGLIVTRPGSGAYIAEVLGAVFAPPLVNLFSTHDEAMFDYISFRKDMEGIAAERAATLGSDTDLRVIDAIFGKMEAAHESRIAKDEASLDADFHLSIVEASHNVVMLHTMRAMYDMLKQGVFYNRQLLFGMKTTRAELLDQHRAINAGIQSRDGKTARAAVEAHLGYIEDALQRLVRQRRNEETAQLRFAHERNR
jgi:GntR family transcriptional repressor for pyruvate dehydrogenase complex